VKARGILDLSPIYSDIVENLKVRHVIIHHSAVEERANGETAKWWLSCLGVG
jgi:hypothetical protein